MCLFYYTEVLFSATGDSLQQHLIMKIELFEIHHYRTISTIYSVIFLLSFVLNTSVITIFVGNPSLLTSSNFLLLSMAVSDWLMAVLANTVGAYANSNHWWTLNGSVCQYFAFVSTLFGLTSMVHLTALSVERWMTVKLAMYEELSRRKMAVVIGSLWSFSFVWSLFPLIGWSSFGPEPGFAGCSLTWYSNVLSDKAYIVGLFVFFFFLPIAIIIYCYGSVYIAVKKLTNDAVARWGNEAPPTQQTMRAKAKTIKMSVVMVFAYLIAWTPYAIVSLYSSFIANDITPLLSTMPSFFAKLSSCYNPIIYFFMYTKFRKAAKKMILKHLNASESISGQQISNTFATSFPRVRSLFRLKSTTVAPMPETVNQGAYVQTNPSLQANKTAES
jgi:visual pigment-like receptor peropsin/c-opsin